MKGKRRCKDGKPQRKDERLSLDIISALPQAILEIILCRLPTKEAARTSILSSEWRYKWTKIPKLEFEHYQDTENTSTKMGMRCRHFNEIHQVLLLPQGPINELDIEICDDCYTSELDQIILHLAKSHKVEKLRLHRWDEGALYNIPISLFSLHHLTELDLRFVDLDHEPELNGFGRLRSLVLFDVRITSKSLLHLLSNCPSLKSFTLLVSDDEHVIHIDCCTIIHLFNSLPMIERLKIFTPVDQLLHLDSIQQEHPTLLLHLNYFCYEVMDFNEAHVLMFLLVLIKCSPNLENISLQNVGYDLYDECPVVWEDYSDIWLEHLSELTIGGFNNSKPEMEFVKFILASSPKLKKVTIYSNVKWDFESKMLKTLLEAPRASPVIITVK